jgi:hypothetical protein
MLIVEWKACALICFDIRGRPLVISLRMPRLPRFAWKRIALWSIPAVLVLACLGAIVAKSALDAYLRSERFRAFLAAKAGGTLRAEAEVTPLHFDGAGLYTDSFAAHGTTAAKFSQLQLDGLRAEISWGHVLQHAWRVEQLDIQRLRADLNGPRLVAPEEPKIAHERVADANRSGWLPDRVEIGTATIRDTQLAWDGGTLRGTALQLQPADGGWSITGSGGTITHRTLPPLTVQQLDLGYRGNTLFVRSAEFRQGDGGSVTASGEIDFDQRLELRAVLQNVALNPWLAGDWRARLHGDASGEVRIHSGLPLDGAPDISGTLSLAHGQLEALPVLNQIATFTRSQEFRRLTLNRASCEFTQQGPRLAVRNLLVESSGLLRVEGGFTVERGTIDGTFQVGVTPGSLQWLPGSQARVFTVSRDGYLWTPMRLTGPLGSPTEDLTPRLVAAAGDEVIEQVGGAVKDATKQLKEATKGALDLLLGPSR